MQSDLKLKNVNLLNDTLFKSLFRSQETREAVIIFLNRITGISITRLSEAKFYGGELIKKNIHEKGKISDIIIDVDKYTKIIIEMNQFKTRNIFEKNISYAMNLILESTRPKDNKYPRVYLINIDNFNAFQEDDDIVKMNIQDKKHQKESVMYESFHLILANIVKESYNKDRELQKMSRILLSKSFEELKNNCEKGGKKYMAIFKKVEELLSEHPELEGYYYKGESMKQIVTDSYEDGKRENQLVAIKNMLKENLPLETIAKYLNLSVNKVKQLKNEIH